MSLEPTAPASSGPAVKTSMSANGVLEIVVSRPAVHNAINREVSSRLLAALEEGRSNPEVRATILRGEGPSFSSGQDLREAASTDHIRRLQDICRALRNGAPTIAAVHGHAIGGGAEIAFACDFVVAASGARFRLPEVEIGLAPGGGVSMFLMSAAGPGRAASLLLLGEELTARQAGEAGLLHSVVDESELWVTARALANTLARRDPAALRRAKRCLQSAWAKLYETAYATESEAMIAAGQAHWPEHVAATGPREDQPASPPVPHP